MLKNKHSLQITSGILSASGVCTTLVSAELQNEQKIREVNNASDLKDSKAEKILKGALVTAIAATGLGLLGLIVWAFVHKYIAIKDLNSILSEYEVLQEKDINETKQIEKSEKKIEECERNIEECKKEVNEELVFYIDGETVKLSDVVVDLSNMTYEQIHKISDESPCYGKNTIEQIASMEKIKSNFLELLEKNKESLREMGEIYEISFDLDLIKNMGFYGSKADKPKDFEVTRILDIFEKEELYKKNSDNFDIEIAFSDYQIRINDILLRRNVAKYVGEEEVLQEKEKTLKTTREIFEIWGKVILPAFKKAKEKEKALKKLLESPKVKEEKSITDKIKQNLWDKWVALRQRAEHKKESNEIKESLNKMEENMKEAKRRKESLQNNFWDFGNNFFKLHGNDNLLTEFNKIK